jgi:hypothetical protein
MVDQHLILAVPEIEEEHDMARHMTRKLILIGGLLVVLLGGVAATAIAVAERNPDARTALVSPAAKAALMQQRIAAQQAAAAAARNTTLLHPGYLPGGQVPQLKTGIFPMSDGAPAAIPMRLFQLTNRAQMQANNVYTIVYAGALASNLHQGTLAVFQENLVTGAESQHEYPAPRADGALTLTGMHGTILTFTTPGSHGTFDVATGQFHY